MSNLKPYVKYFYDEMPRLEMIDKGDWCDLRAMGIYKNGQPINWMIGTNGEQYIAYEAGDFLLVGTGIAMQMPYNFEAHVVPRSSTFKKYGLLQTNHMGVIDNSYCGDNDEWFIPMVAMRKGYFARQTRLAQFRLVRKMPPIEFVEVDALESPDRGGHGSTGDK